MVRSHRVRVALLTLAISVASSATAQAATTLQPSPAEARTFGTTNGGWGASADFGGLVCIPGVDCPVASPSHQAAGGAGGAGDGFLRDGFGTRLGMTGATITIAWESPIFVAPARTTGASLSLAVRPQIASLLAIGTVRLTTRLIDVASPADSSVIATTPLTTASASFGTVTIPVPAGAVVSGRTYRLVVAVGQRANVSAVTSGNVDLDDVVLTIASGMPPRDLAATVPASGPLRVTGGVDPDGLSTTVRVDYGLTAAYDSATAPVTLNGSGAQPFSIPLRGLTPGETYHYCVTADNEDGTTSSSDATFVAPSAPATTAPTVTGDDNSRDRTVTYARAGDVVDASVELLDGGANVVDTVADSDDDGTVAIVLPDADGTYGIRVVRENDRELRSTSTSVPAVLDRVAPSVAGVGLTVTPLLSPDQEREIAFTAPGDAATIGAQVLDAADAPVGPSVTPVAGAATVWLGAADGDYRVRLTLTDAAGNTATVLSDVVTRDTVAPAPGGAPTVTGPLNGRDREVSFGRDPSTESAWIEVLDATTANVVTVAVPAGASAEVTLPDLDGEYSVRVRQADGAGNSDASPTVTTALDRVAPTVVGVGLTVTPRLSFEREREIAFIAPVDAATVRAQAIDAADADVGAPVTPVAGAATVELGAADGDYRVRLTLTDAAGNGATVISDTVTLDTGAPAPGPAPAVTGALTGRDRDVAFDRDASTESARVEVLDADDQLVVTVPVSTGASAAVSLPDLDGDYAVRVRQTDGAGNSATTPEAATVLDRIAPDAGPAPAVSGSLDALAVGFARATDAALATIEVRDGAEAVVATVAVPAGDTGTVDLPDADGDYVLRVVQEDAAGNSAASPSTTVTRAPAPPPAPTPTPTPTPTPRGDDRPGDAPKPPIVPIGPVEQPRACLRGEVVLTDVTLRGGRMRVSGVASHPAGTAVAILDRAGKQVARTPVDAAGRFAATTRAPRAAALGSAGYRAAVGVRRSPLVTVRRANAIRGAATSANGATITVRGRVDLARLGRVMQLTAHVGSGVCGVGDGLLRAVGKPVVDPRTGVYEIVVRAPARAGRLTVRTRAVGERISSASSFVVI